MTTQPSPLDPIASERLSHANKVFTSDLSINEFALLHGAGFEPIDLVTVSYTHLDVYKRQRFGWHLAQGHKHLDDVVV